MENIFKLVEFAVKGKILLQVSFVFSLSALLHFVLCLVLTRCSAVQEIMFSQFVVDLLIA